MLESYQKFDEAAEKCRVADDIEDFYQSVDYGDVRRYLNIHELLAVSVMQKIFDEGVCYHYWSSALERACADTDKLLTYIRRRPEDEYTYKQMLRLNKRWSSKRRFWQRWRD